MLRRLHRATLVALLVMGSAMLLFSCKSQQVEEEEAQDAIMTEESENLTIIMSENGRRSYTFKTPLLEGYTLARDPYREFRKGISITTYQDDSLTTTDVVLVANYAIYYEKRKLWEAKGDVVVTKHDGTRLYTQQLFWNSMTKRIYSNVDTKLVTETDEIVGEGFESDEEMTQPRFRRWKGRMEVDADELRNDSGDSDDESADDRAEEERKDADKAAKKEPVKDDKPKSAPSKRAEQKRDASAEASLNIPTPKLNRVAPPVSGPDNKPMSAPIGNQELSTSKLSMNSGLKGN